MILETRLPVFLKHMCSIFFVVSIYCIVNQFISDNNKKTGNLGMRLGFLLVYNYIHRLQTYVSRGMSD